MAKVTTSFLTIQKDRILALNAFEIIFRNEGAQTVTVGAESSQGAVTIPPIIAVSSVDTYEEFRLYCEPDFQDATPFEIKFSGTGTKKLVIIIRRLIK